jgi:hypothetical protein
LKAKKLIICAIFILSGCQANTAVKPTTSVQPTLTAEQRDFNDKPAKISQALATADSEYRAYIESKRNAWAYEQLKKNCHNIQNREYEKFFIRYMQKKHPIESKQVIFDSSPASIRLTKMFADIFMSKEVIPRQKDFYLSYGRCPSLNELHFPY